MRTWREITKCRKSEISLETGKTVFCQSVGFKPMRRWVHYIET